MGELEFQQPWELRRNKDDGLDSSFNGSKSTEQLLKKHMPVSNSVSVDDDDDDGTNRSEQKNPGTGDHITIGKARRCRTRNVSNKLTRDCPEKIDTSVHVAEPLDELKSMMESLLKDLKVTREDLLKWILEEMKELVADFTRPEPKRRRQCQGRKKVHLQKMKKSKKVEDQCEKPHKESIQFRHPNNSEKNIQLPEDRAKKISANAYLQRSSDQNGKVLQGHESVVLAIEAQKGKGGSFKRIDKGKKTVDRSDRHHQVPEDQAMTTALSTEPIVANHGLDASFFNYIQASSNHGSFPVIDSDERTRSFALMGSKNMGSLDLNSPSASSIGTGFSFPFQQAIDVGSSSTREINPQYLSRENNNKQLSLMMNGGSYNLSEIIKSNNHHCFMSYHMQNFKDGHLFRQ